MRARAVLGGLLAMLVAMPLHAGADRYARQWPIATSRDAGAYRVLLAPDVYRSVQRADLRDLDVLDASGRSVPAEVLQQASRPVARRHDVPWFAMPGPGRGAAGDWQLIAEVGADGGLRMLRSGASVDADRASALLLDTGAVDGAPTAIEFDWSPAAPFDRGYRVEASDDLQDWVAVGAGRLVDLRQSGRRLVRQRIELHGLSAVRRARFLRLVPEQDVPLPAITRATVLTQAPAGQRPAWLSLAPVDTTNDGHVYASGGRFPIEWVDIDTSGNDARLWTVQSRDAPDGEWATRVADWMVYNVGTGTRSGARRLDRPLRDRYWRLVPRTAGAGAPPTLRLGYRPEVVGFVAAGMAPYTLVAGSAQAVRAPAPVAGMLDTVRREQGPGWQPAVATLGPPQDAAGREALRPRRDWATWGLWAVLALGALVVGAFALRLLREPTSDR